MSYSLKYYPDPGIAFDISKMLFVKLNSQTAWQTALASVDSNSSEITHIQKYASLLPEPDIEVLLFTYIPSNKSTTFLSILISKLIYQDFKSFTVSKLQKYLENSELIQADLLLYYLGEQKYSHSDLERIIRINKNIPDRVKILLLGFILNPYKYLNTLSQVITKYYQLIYKNWIIPNEVPFLPDSFIDCVIQNTYSNELPILSFIQEHTISFSLCFSTFDFLLRHFTSENPFIITASETVNQMLASTPHLDTSTLILVANALSDKHRINIIQKLISRDNLTIQELSSLIGLSTSATNHHLSILKKANIVSAKRHNRSVLYSYNSKGTKIIHNSLLTIEKGGTQE